MPRNRTDTRDVRAIATTACPRCHARAGQPCHEGPGAAATLRATIGETRPQCHKERRAAWVEAKRAK